MVVYTPPALSFHPNQLIGQICLSAQWNIVDENPRCTLNDQRCDEEFKDILKGLTKKPTTNIEGTGLIRIKLFLITLFISHYWLKSLE
jgi:hypothetical protein